MAKGEDRGRNGWADRAQNRWLWAGFAMPGIIWLALLFLVPFYTVLAIAGGQLNTIFQSPEPVWNPLNWTGANFTAVFHDLVGQGSFVGPIFARTLVYVTIASVLSLLIAYPAAYFVTRFAGRRKVFFLALLDSPVLGQLHDAHAGLDRPAADRRVRKPGAARPTPSSASRSTGWAESRRPSSSDSCTGTSPT